MAFKLFYETDVQQDAKTWEFHYENKLCSY